MRGAMLDCYKCGVAIRRGAGFRREVEIGHSRRRGYYRGRFSGSSGISYGWRTLCPRCTQAYDAKKRMGSITAAIFLLILLIGGYLDQKNRPALSSASIAVIPSVAMVHRHRAGHAYPASTRPAETFADADELWTLNRDVTALTDEGGTRKLHAGRPIRVTGKAVYTLRIRLHDGTTAYVPVGMATYSSVWASAAH
jgi:hypothetical protein